MAARTKHFRARHVSRAGRVDRTAFPAKCYRICAVRSTGRISYAAMGGLGALVRRALPETFATRNSRTSNSLSLRVVTST
jgi:hypothetical protein